LVREEDMMDSWANGHAAWRGIAAGNEAGGAEAGGDFERGGAYLGGWGRCQGARG
jgi:hypothetical protein